MNILVIAPHPDDEAIGCGGTLCNHSARGDRVAVVFLTSGELGLKRLSCEQAWRIREAEAKKAAKILAIARIDFLRLPDWSLGDQAQAAARRLQPILKRERPKLIYLPHPGEWHPDHKVAFSILAAALLQSGFTLPELRGYEVWTPLAEHHHAENITAVMPRKLRALRAHRSQLDDFDYERAVRGLNQFRGELAGRCRYAEVFESISLKPHP